MIFLNKILLNQYQLIKYQILQVMLSFIKLFSKKSFRLQNLQNKIQKYSNQIYFILPYFQLSIEYSTQIINLRSLLQSDNFYYRNNVFFKESLETSAVFYFDCRTQWKSILKTKCIQIWESYETILENIVRFFIDLSKLNDVQEIVQRAQLKQLVLLIKRTVQMQNNNLDNGKEVLKEFLDMFKRICKMDSNFLKFLKFNIISIIVFLKKINGISQFFYQITTNFTQIQIITNQCQSHLYQIDFQISTKNLKILINQYIHSKFKQTQICQNCEQMISFTNMNKHLLACKQRYDTEQKIQRIDNQINVKMADVNSYIMEIKKIQLQFIKIQEKQKEVQKKKNKLVKSRNRLGNKSYKFSHQNHISNQFQLGCQQQQQKHCSGQSKFKIGKKNKKNLKQLQKEQLNEYLKLIQQIKFVGNKFKSSKRLLYRYLKHIKEFTKPKLQEFNVNSQQINHIINLFMERIDLILKQRKSNFSFKIQGVCTDTNFIHNEFEDLQCQKFLPESNIYNQTIMKTKNKKKYSDQYYSDQQSNNIRSIINSNDNNEICLNDFKTIRKLGQGTYGEVFLVMKKKTGVRYALKKIYVGNQKKQTQSNLNTQNNIFQMLNHPFIAKAIYSFHENNFHYFVMEYLPNGDFSQLISQETRLYQYQAKQSLAEIVLAIEHLHMNDIIHKDLKPQNIIIDAEGHMKLTDFGLCESKIEKKKNQQARSHKFSNFILKELKKKEKVVKQNGSNKIVGSPYYMAPQMFKGQKINYMADWWSFGILMYQTLLGIPPFSGKNHEQIKANIYKHDIWPQQVQFGDDPYEMISYEAKDLIDQLLIIDPKKRIGLEIQDIKTHNFFYGIDWQNLQKVNEEILQLVKERQNKQEDGYQTEQQQYKYKKDNRYSPTQNIGFSRRDLLIKQTHIQHIKKIEKYENLLLYANNIAK